MDPQVTTIVGVVFVGLAVMQFTFWFRDRAFDQGYDTALDHAEGIAKRSPMLSAREIIRVLRKEQKK